MGRKGLGKGRSNITYQNKVNKMKKFYRRVFKNSKAQKERNEKVKYNNPKKKYFCDKYPTEKDFLKTIKIKEANKTKPVSSFKSVI